MKSQVRVPALVIFFVAMAVMLLEVALTRIFSFITYHHMTYLVIGVAMLGFGAAGTFLTIYGKTSLESGGVARHAAYFAVATMVALFLIPRVQFQPMNMYRVGHYWNLVALFPLTLLTAAPFFFGGVCIAALISHAGRAVNVIYFADLAGSAVGALLAILLIDKLGAVASSVVAATVALLGASVAAQSKRWRFLVAAAVVAVFAPLSENPEVLRLHAPPGKQLYGSEDSIELTQWHVITRLDVGSPMDCKCSFGGALSYTYSGLAPMARLIFQDGSNLTGIVHPTPTPQETPVFGYYMQGAPYAIRPNATGLVIGSGGGIDVMVGLHHGAKRITAVDVNPKTMALVRGPYADFAGNVFNGESVEPIVSEGRHFLSRDRRSFDVIQLSGVDTWAAQASGAYALTENFIYTTEAFDEYLRHLKPEGILGFSRPYVQPPLETLRLVATAVEALERDGAAQPGRHIFMLAGHGQASDAPWGEMLVKRAPFTEEETTKLGEWTKKLNFDVVYDPHRVTGGPLDDVATSSKKERARLLDEYPLDVRPVPDDRPFYFQNHHWRDLVGQPPLGLAPPMAMWILAGSFLQVLVLSGALILYPLYRKRSAAAERGGRVGVFFYFGALGMGFILVEIALLQKLMVFVGGPTYAMAITLFTLLLASGLGASYLRRPRRNRPY